MMPSDFRIRIVCGHIDIFRIRETSLFPLIVDASDILLHILDCCIHIPVGELLDLKKENVNLEERYFKIVASKTAAGIRTAPISEKVHPFFEYWYNLNDCEYLLSTPEGEHFKYRNYYDSYWSPLIETLGMKHRPHDTRHTCISMLTVAGVSDKVIKKIVGHKGQGVTEVVYTHFEIEELIDAINKI